MTETPIEESYGIESVSPSLHLGAVTAIRSTWLGPLWAAVCGLIASAAFRFDGPNVLIAALLFIVADWAWPALWTTLVRTDWLAPFARWRAVPTAEGVPRLPYIQPGSPGDRLLKWLAHLDAWRRSVLAPLAGSSGLSACVALSIALVLSAVIGWRALALTLAALALSSLGTLRALRTGVDSDELRSIVYGTLPWWLGHAAFAPLTAASAGMGLLFGLAYSGLMAAGPRAPRSIALIAPQLVAALVLFTGGQPLAAFIVGVSIAAQAALRTFLLEHAFARRAQVWLMATMLAAAIAVT